MGAGGSKVKKDEETTFVIPKNADEKVKNMIHQKRLEMEYEQNKQLQVIAKDTKNSEKSNEQLV